MQTNAANREKFEPVPLVLGVTGHMDILPEDTGLLEEVTGAFLCDLRRQYPHTPLVVLSPLAEGADRLVARVALSQGAGLIAPLPMERELYIQDCATPESRNEFESLLRQADRWYELPPLPGVSREQIAQPGPERDQQYEAVGFHISRKCQILVAVMEEMTSGSQTRRGGTHQIVLGRLGRISDALAHDLGATGTGLSAAALDEYPSMEPMLHLENAGPVFQITARRKKNAVPSEAFRPKGIWHAPDKTEDDSESDALSHFTTIWKRIDDYNQDMAAMRGPGIAARLAAGRESLLPGQQAQNLAADLQRIRQAHALADCLASAMQKTATRTIQVLFLLAFAAFITFSVFAYAIWDSPYILLAYPTLIGLAYLCYPPDRLQRWFWFVYRHCGWLAAYNKYLDYRALAEGLRVQFYWRLSGLSDSVAAHCLRKQNADVDWIREALSNFHIVTRPPEDATPKPPAEQNLGLVREAWIRGQAEWFAGKAAQQGPKIEAAIARGQMLIAAGILTAIGLGAILLMIPDFRDWMLPGTAISVMDTIHGLLELAAVAGALRLEYLNKLFTEEQVKRYEKMGKLFLRADQHLALYLSHSCPNRARNLLREIGKEALDESTDWLVLHRQNPPEVQT